MAEIIYTPQGVAFLSDTPAVMGVDGLPFCPTTYLSASLYPGIWTPQDAQASLLVYRQWNEREGELGRYWIDQVEAAEDNRPAILAAIQRLEGFHAMAGSILQAITDHTPLPRWVLPAGDPIADEMAQLFSAIAQFPTDLLDEGGGWFKERLAEYQQIFERTIAHWRGVLEDHQRLSDQVLVLLQTQPLAEPPLIYAVHDGQHILDQPECSTIGAGREKASPWLN